MGNYKKKSDQEIILGLSSVIENAPYMLDKDYEAKVGGSCTGSSSSSSHSSNSSSHSASRSNKDYNALTIKKVGGSCTGSSSSSSHSSNSSSHSASRSTKGLESKV